MKTRAKSYLVICLAIFLAGCNYTVPVNLPAHSTASPNRRPPTLTSIVETPLIVPASVTPTTTISPSDTPLPISTETSTPTWTPRPTLPPDKARSFALKTFRTNGGCLLPCWIGISPGKTTWNEAYTYLATFADEIIRDNPLDPIHVVSFKFPDTSYGGVSGIGATIYVRDGMVDKISAPEDISLAELLNTYGPPTEIRILAIALSTMSPIGRFTLILFYQDQGILAVYEGTNEKSEIIHICPNNIYQGLQPLWLLWAPADNLTFTEAGKQTLLISPYPPPSEADYIPLENLVGIDINSFTQRYKDPKNQGICMEMQAPDKS